MGCRSSRSIYDNPSDDNRQLSYFERNLGFSAWSVSQVEAVLRRVLNPSIKPSDAFTRFIKTLNLKLTLTMETKILSSDENLFNFGALAIMLAEGSHQEKAETIWYLIDTNLQDSLSSQDLTKLISTIVTASYIFTPDLFASVSTEKEAKISSYNQTLKEKSSHLTDKLLKFFLDGESTLTKSKFLTKLSEGSTGLIFSPFNLRCQMEHTQVIPKKYANQFANLKRVNLTAKKLS
jgi:hypothetical protein